VNSKKALGFLGVAAVLLAIAAYPSVHAWLIDDTKIVVPGGRLAAEWSAIPKRPGDKMVESPKVFDKLSLAGAGANFDSSATDEEIFEFYTSELRTLGWSPQPKISGRREIQFCKDGVGAIVQIEENPGKTYYFGLESGNQKRSLNYCWGPGGSQDTGAKSDEPSARKETKK
jgi:hypothetical protein